MLRVKTKGISLSLGKARRQCSTQKLQQYSNVKLSKNAYLIEQTRDQKLDNKENIQKPRSISLKPTSGKRRQRGKSSEHQGQHFFGKNVRNIIVQKQEHIDEKIQILKNYQLGLTHMKNKPSFLGSDNTIVHSKRILTEQNHNITKQSFCARFSTLSNIPFPYSSSFERVQTENTFNRGKNMERWQQKYLHQSKMQKLEKNFNQNTLSSIPNINNVNKTVLLKKPQKSAAETRKSFGQIQAMIDGLILATKKQQ